MSWLESWSRSVAILVPVILASVYLFSLGFIEEVGLPFYPTIFEAASFYLNAVVEKLSASTFISTQRWIAVISVIASFFAVRLLPIPVDRKFGSFLAIATSVPALYTGWALRQEFLILIPALTTGFALFFKKFQTLFLRQEYLTEQKIFTVSLLILSLVTWTLPFHTGQRAAKQMMAKPTKRANYYFGEEHFGLPLWIGAEKTYFVECGPQAAKVFVSVADEVRVVKNADDRIFTYACRE
ncbi:MAG: hypothetical protein EOP05_00445 [Proteobacteria bacterium]|nr:MAG: hypothetical protein EOP05_00445 [Pseudomonadota bacterium]